MKIKRFTARNFRQICDELSSRHPDLALVIKVHSYPPMWTRPNTFETLVHIILEQQVSLASALTALQKLKQRLLTVTPNALLALTDEELKSCYFSRQKMIYVRGLATELSEKKLELLALENLPDEDVRTRLIKIKGIGNWTVDVYLMFVLQRADIFPIGDTAAVNALKRIRNMEKDTPKKDLLHVAAEWQPYRTIATMILWHYYLSTPVKRER